MASISIVVTDNENGVINHSFNFTEQEIKRIYSSLGDVYRPQLEREEFDAQGNSVLTQYNPSAKDVFDVLSSSLISHVLNTCYQAEIDQVVQKFKEANLPFELRGQS